MGDLPLLRAAYRRAGRQPRVLRAGRSREPWPTWVEDSRGGARATVVPDVPPHPSDPGRRGRARGRGRRGRRRRVVRRRRRARGGASGGKPPVLVDLGVRTDPEAARLRRAAGKHSHGDFAGARAEFAGRSLQAEAGEAISAWPDGTLERLEDLATLHPRRRSALPPRPRPVLERRHGRGSRGVADDAHAGARHGVRRSGGGSALPRRSARSPDVRSRLSRAARGAGHGGAGAVRRAPEDGSAGRSSRKLLYGVALQRVERPVSARREFSAAAKLAPNDADALVADAIGRFDKEHPERAFSRMGPLTRRFPRAGTVRFHLGLMLLWLGDLEEARRQLGRATRLGPPIWKQNGSSTV